MTDDELRELRQLIETSSGFQIRATLVKWISSVLERRLAAAQAMDLTVQNRISEQQRLLARGFVPGQPTTQKAAKASVAVTRSAFRKGG